MNVVLGVVVALVAVASAFAQTQPTPEETEADKAVETLNDQMAKLEDTAGLGGEGYTGRLSGSQMYCEFFAQMQQMYPLYKDMSCLARN